MNNASYSGNNIVEVYFISWYGCPNDTHQYYRLATT
ncbi:DUF929 family protein [Metallosphaera javensis (ex Sakai et al. 2022)]